jgi:hypothetical protein
MNVFDLRDRLVGDYASYTRAKTAKMNYFLRCKKCRSKSMKIKDFVLLVPFSLSETIGVLS